MHRQRMTTTLAAGLSLAIAGSMVGTPGTPLRMQAAQVSGSAAGLPRELTDAELWRLMTDFAEPGGGFHADNFTSNEAGVAYVAAELATRRPGGAYLGVGPEQNFSYIVALRPEIAFIVDIRRQAVVQHLLFKALFELSDDRVDFLSRLFSVPRADVAPGAPLEVIWKSIPRGPGADRERYLRNRADVQSHLLKTRRLPLPAEDLASLDYVYNSFFTLGPTINYAGTQPRLTTGGMDFERLSLAEDGQGIRRSFLATEEAFQSVKRMHARNLIVPVQGDFGGPTTLRAIGDYLRTRGSVVNAFYISNVEQYLFGRSSAPATDVNGGWRNFYGNLATLPIDAASVLVRAPLLSAPRGGVRRPSTPALCAIAPFLAAVNASRVATLEQARQCASGQPGASRHSY
jgi:hypothetical protein